MSRINHVQFNVRSAFARERAHELAKQTGMTVTQVVEEALRGYVPPAATPLPPGVERRGSILVITEPRPPISFAEAEAALMAVRERDLED
jgi:hypothetical protein